MRHRPHKFDGHLGLSGHPSVGWHPLKIWGWVVGKTYEITIWLGEWTSTSYDLGYVGSWGFDHTAFGHCSFWSAQRSADKWNEDNLAKRANIMWHSMWTNKKWDATNKHGDRWLETMGKTSKPLLNGEWPWSRESLRLINHLGGRHRFQSVETRRLSLGSNTFQLWRIGFSGEFESTNPELEEKSHG